MPVAAKLLTVTVLDVVSVVALTDAPATEPPVIATLLAFCVAIVPAPETSAIGIVALAVSGAVPLPLTYPVSVLAPVPPDAVLSVPPKVIAPDAAAAGVKPVPPPETVLTNPVPTVNVETFGFCNQISHSRAGLPVTGSRNGLCG